MNAKRKLNCYFYSNLVICFLTMNFLVNRPVEKTVLVTNQDTNFYNTYAQVLSSSNIIRSYDIETNNNTTTSTTISVTNKEVASKNLTYVKPSYNGVTGANLVDYAKKYLGLRYVSGGYSLETGTDCSGFTKLIFQEFGINLSRSVTTQMHNGRYVSRADLKPGDLVFYGNSVNNPSHVGIYIGSGLIIHESNRRDGVKISSINIMVYITARRVITADVKPKEEVVVETNETDFNVNSEVADKNQNNNNDLQDKVETKEPTVSETLPSEDSKVEDSTKPNNQPVIDENNDIKEPASDNNQSTSKNESDDANLNNDNNNLEENVDSNNNLVDDSVNFSE